MAESKSHADTYHRHGKADPKKWAEKDAVTGREAKVASRNTTFADRAKSGAAENKAVQAAEAKSEQHEDEQPKPEKRTTSRKAAPKKDA